MLASAQKASSVELQMRVARVGKPAGASSRVIGSSFMASSTSPAAAASPGAISGRSIVASPRRRPWPRVRAASSRRRGTPEAATCAGPRARAPKWRA